MWGRGVESAEEGVGLDVFREQHLRPEVKEHSRSLTTIHIIDNTS